MVRLPMGEGHQRGRIRFLHTLLLVVVFAGARFLRMAGAGVIRDAIHPAAVMGKPVCANSIWPAKSRWTFATKGAWLGLHLRPNVITERLGL